MHRKCFFSFKKNSGWPLNLDPNSNFSKAASSTLGRFVTKPMTRDEACKILNLEEQPELNHKEVLEVSSFLRGIRRFHPIAFQIANSVPFSGSRNFSRKTCQPRAAPSISNRKYTLQRSIWCRISRQSSISRSSTQGRSSRRRKRKPRIPRKRKRRRSDN